MGQVKIDSSPKFSLYFHYENIFAELLDVHQVEKFIKQMSAIEPDGKELALGVIYRIKDSKRKNKQQIFNKGKKTCWWINKAVGSETESR